MAHSPGNARVDSPHFTMLDGMRGIGALVIVAGHAMMPLDLYRLIPHAQVGVDLFFALSGFVICHAYQARMERGMTVSDFSMRRWIRLYPIMPVAIALGALVYAIKVVVQHRPDMLAHIFGSSLLHSVFLPSPLLLGDKEIEGWAINPPLWSLTAELIANLAFGFGLWRFRARGLSVVALVGAALFSLCAFTAGTTNVGGEWSQLYMGGIRVIYPFCAGMVLWHITRKHRPTRQFPAVLVLGFMLAVILAPDMGRFNVAYGLFAVWIAVPAIVYVGAFRSSIQSKFVLLLGELSYPVYLIHFPVVRIFSFATKKLNVDLSPVVVIGLQVLVSTALGYVFWRFYDVPVRNWLTAWSKKRSTAAVRPAASLEAAE